MNDIRITRDHTEALRAARLSAVELDVDRDTEGHATVYRRQRGPYPLRTAGPLRAREERDPQSWAGRRRAS